MHKIKICFIQTYCYSLFNKNLNQKFGGSEVQLFLISKELSKDKNFSISFIVGDFGQEKIEESGNIKLYKSCTPKTNDNLIIKFFQAIKYYNLLNKINADVYFTSTANSIIGIVSLFCKRKNKKHIHRTAHIMDVDKSFIKSNGILGNIYRYGLEKSDLIITQCNDYKKLLKINHDIDSTVIKNSFEIIERKRINKQFILWVARYEKWKRPDLFLRLAKFFPNKKFIMCCNKNENMGKEWEEIKNKAIRLKNMKFYEEISINEIQDFFDKAKVFINTSEYEGFPNTFIQAGIGKTPILSLNVNPDNFINKYNCGFYCNNDFEIMKNYLEKLLNNKIIYNKTSMNIFRYVKSNHNIKNNIKEIKAVVFNLTKKGIK